MTLDLSFLSVPLRAMPTPARPVNVYDILRDGWRETRVDMTLQFFLTPNEQHGLGSLVIDALLATLDGAALIGEDGRTDGRFVADDFMGSDTWEVESQVSFIDVLAKNVDRGLAIVLENKIGAALDNPLDQYARSALAHEGIQHVLVAVLAPERRTAHEAQENWLSRAITYAELTGHIKSSPALVDHLLSPVDRDQARSLDLLQQFMEARKGDTDVNDVAGEAARVEEWRNLLHEHGDAIQQFLEARSRAGGLIRARNKRLEPLIAARLADAGLNTEWEAHGGSGTETWNAYHFPAPDWSVELKLTLDPKRPSIFVFDYPKRTYRNTTVDPLGLEWDASDEAVADAFVARVHNILEQAAAGTRAG